MEERSSMEAYAPVASQQAVMAAQYVANLFMSYGQHAAARIARVEGLLPSHMQAMLPEVCARLQKQHEAVEVNRQFLTDILLAAKLVTPDDAPLPLEESIDDPGSIHALLVQLKREWSADGASERQECFGLCLEALEKHLPVDQAAAAGGAAGNKRARVVVPGAGLGRLNFELACRGYDALGLERAMTMYMTSQYILSNLLPSRRTMPICPYAHEAGMGPSNVRLAEQLARTVLVPDPAALAAGGDIRSGGRGDARMLPGDFNAFCALEREQGEWDAVVSAFYVDASGDPLEATLATRAALRPGGLWVCCGPLEYDGGAAGHASADTLRLCGDELLLFVSRSGFDILEVADSPCGYTSDSLSMLQQGFKALFFVARKK